ncbi:hypothetical protein B0H13DRAFT_1928805 [Mycena leptocephala]|nr:hypothetical protein B0H13DRAFT_1928805 [Mycena leptocephala]
MDVCALSRFHASVTRLPIESQSIPAGGLHRFLREDLCPKVFLVSATVLEDRWSTACIVSFTKEEIFNLRVCMRIIVDHMSYCGRLRLNELRVSHNRFNTPAEASWMFYLISVFLHAIGFDGDDTDVGPGFNPLEMAKSEVEFLLCRSTEKAFFAAAWNALRPWNTRNTTFPNLFRTFVKRKHFLFLAIWPLLQKFVEATLVALSRVKSQVKVETDEDGIVTGVLKSSVDEVLAEMVEGFLNPTSPNTHTGALLSSNFTVARKCTVSTAGALAQRGYAPPPPLARPSFLPQDLYVAGKISPQCLK